MPRVSKRNTEARNGQKIQNHGTENKYNTNINMKKSFSPLVMIGTNK